MGKAFWELQAISDAELLRGLAELQQKGRRVTAELVAHLAEVERRRLHLYAACGSLFEYCVARLGLSEDEACRRIEAAQLGRRFPELFALLASGDLSLSVVALLKPYLSADNHRELFRVVAGQSVRQARERLAARFPQPDVRSSVRKLPAGGIARGTEAPAGVGAAADTAGGAGGEADAARGARAIANVEGEVRTVDARIDAQARCGGSGYGYASSEPCSYTRQGADRPAVDGALSRATYGGGVAEAEARVVAGLDAAPEPERRSGADRGAGPRAVARTADEATLRSGGAGVEEGGPACLCRNDADICNGAFCRGCSYDNRGGSSWSHARGGVAACAVRACRQRDPSRRQRPRRSALHLGRREWRALRVARLARVRSPGAAGQRRRLGGGKCSIIVQGAQPAVGRVALRSNACRAGHRRAEAEVGRAARGSRRGIVRRAQHASPPPTAGALAHRSPPPAGCSLHLRLSDKTFGSSLSTWPPMRDTAGPRLEVRSAMSRSGDRDTAPREAALGCVGQRWARKAFGARDADVGERASAPGSGHWRASVGVGRWTARAEAPHGRSTWRRMELAQVGCGEAAPASFRGCTVAGLPVTAGAASVPAPCRAQVSLADVGPEPVAAGLVQCLHRRHAEQVSA